jgi:hypothetical protein
MRNAIATKGSRRLMLVAVGLLAAVAVLPLLVPPSAAACRPRGAPPRGGRPARAAAPSRLDRGTAG